MPATDPRAAASPNGAVSVAGWTMLHFAATWCAVAAAIAMRFHDGEALRAVPAALHAMAAAFALALARALRVPLTDFLKQLQYSERFLLFLAHLAAMLVPWFFGFRGWGHALSVLAVVLCAQAVDSVVFGRIYGATMLLAVPAMLVPPLPPFPLAAAWLLALLLAFRAEHVRTRLETLGHGEGTTVADAARGTLVGAVLPWALGCAAWLAAAATFGETRALQFDPGPVNPERTGNIGPVSPTDLLWDAVMVVGTIVALLLTLYWLEKFLRANRKPAAAGEEAPGTGRETRVARAADEAPPAEEPFGDDPRGRVLARFRAFDRSLARAGRQRFPHETVPEFLSRLARELLAGSPEPLAPVFDRACYSNMPLAEEDANLFLRLADAVEPCILQLADNERAREEAKPPSWRDEPK